METQEMLQRAAEAVATAQGILIGAGAGMGVDSGMPDFRGPQGFWKAYPPYEKLGMNFVDMANPRWFASDPGMAWGFYGHRRNLYRATRPHAGFEILRSWASRMVHGAFVFTSNVDAHFQKAGFSDDYIYEIHGSLEYLQCRASCGAGIFSAGPEEVKVDESTMRAGKPFPACGKCDAMARPNVLMFGDWGWDSARSDEQRNRFEAWVQDLTGPIVVVECGAGTAIPSVRLACEQIASAARGLLIRINVRESNVPSGQVGLALGALAGLTAIDQRLRKIVGH